MKFVYRLGYYLFGFLIGGLFLMFVFKNKRTEFCYMPNCRVLKDIRTKGITVSKEAEAKLKDRWVTMDDIQDILKNGDVDFSKSNKVQPGGGKIYVIEGRTLKNEPVVLEILNKADRSILKDVKK